MAEMKPLEEDDLTKVDASPTKEFFVEIITKDIQLDEAIQDLVDNCIDGAKRLRPGEDSRYDDLEVRIALSDQRFGISDNCGGIPLDVARKYAFKFGRAKGFTPTTRSVGQFGVGMKRALFKMGRNFRVTSVEPASKFKVEADITKWVSDEVAWDFPIKDLEQTPHAEADTGTRIEVWNLDENVGRAFAQATFINHLRNQIRVTQQHPMRRGLVISLNGEAIIPLEWQLKEGDGLTPMFRRFSDEIGGTSPLETRIYAGIGESSTAFAGWYIFCNGRCILAADQTEVTGWSELSEEGTAIPKYHGQFARFRGYAFLDADDASILPWNTTKTGLNLDSPAYRRLKGRLIDATRPVIDFLNALDAEHDMERDDRVLTTAVARAAQKPLEKLSESVVFAYTPPSRKRGPVLVGISYKRPQADVDKLKDALDATSNKDVGEKSFQYAYDNLVDEA